ncbi:MAG: 4Fe-4S ferredoxin, iron-sulfur binding domain protein [Ilumatobacteraceae bacterium]|nr:4Fe-4S ferredoxin, iron-sulfur binding domain protein [Ilumatobacteraceae bacterium]
MTTVVPVDLAEVSAVPVRLGAKPSAVGAHSAVPTGISTRGPELLPLEAGEQYRFGFSMNACIGCHSCEVACAEQNGLPAGTTWRRVGEIEGGAYPETKRFHLSMSCNHCLEPACLEGCPTNAYEKLANGVVAHHAEDCIGCQYCTWNCPYSVPAFQPDRRIVTKCDLCQPRLAEGLAPACVSACPTHAITIERVDVAAWRADHAEADAPHLPSADITISTTRIELPADVPLETFSASDWNLRPEHPHWPLVWLTLVSQFAVGVSATVDGSGQRIMAAALAMAAMAGALLHLGRPAVAWKAFRNLRRSWLSREVALLSLYGGLAAAAVPLDALRWPAAAAGCAGIYASARLYIVPGRPSWNSPLTVVRFGATAVALGPIVTGHRSIAAAGTAIALIATALNWARLMRTPQQPWWGAVRLELRWFTTATSVRFALGVAGIVTLLAGAPLALSLVLVACCELIGRWLFYVAVVPLNMPGAFWRGAAGTHR